MPVQNFFNIDKENGEVVTALLPISEFNSEQYFFMATKNGLIKKTSLSAYASFVNRMGTNGLIALKLNEGDELIGVELSSGDDDVFLFTSNGYAQHFCEYYKRSAVADEDSSDDTDSSDNSQESSDENDDSSIDRHSGAGVRPSGRGSGCIRGIKLRENGKVVSLMVIPPSEVDKQFLIACANGYGKRTRLSDISLRNRGGMGVIVIKNLDRNGEVVGAVLADDNSDYMLITNQGQLIRSSMADTPLVSRSAAGNILMRMYEGDSVMAIQSIPEDVVQNSKKMAEARQKEREELKAAQEAQNSSPSLETALNDKSDESAPENSTDTQTVDSGDNNSDNQ